MDKKLRKILKLYVSRPSLSMKDVGILFGVSPFDCSDDVCYLLEHDYLEVEPNYAIMNNISSSDSTPIDAPLSITVSGRVALDQVMDSVKYRRFNEIRAWITLAISILALIISIVK